MLLVSVEFLVFATLLVIIYSHMQVAKRGLKLQNCLECWQKELVMHLKIPTEGLYSHLNP